MTRTTPLHKLWLILPVALAGCGSSSGDAMRAPSFFSDSIPLLGVLRGNSETTAQASTGYAGPGDVITDNATFTITESPRLIGVSAAPDLRNQTIQVRLDTGTAASVVVDGTRYTLPFDANTNDYRTTIDNSRIALTSIQLAGSGTVELAYLSVFDFDDADQDNTGYISYGVDTAPGDVAVQTGQVSYSGYVQVLARQFEGGTSNAYGAGSGSVALSADFDSNTVAGSFEISNIDSFDGDITVPDARFDILETSITGNGFSGSFEAAANGLPDDLTLTQGGYDGRFYGDDAISAGGTLSGTIAVEGEDNAIILEGGFVADQES